MSDKAKPLWELYDATTGAAVTELYIFKVEPYVKRRDAMAARDHWNHKFGYNLDVRQQK